MGANDELRRSTAPDLEELELELLLEAVVRRFGFDFRLHERAPLKRKLFGFMQQRGLSTLSQLQDRVLHDPATAGDLLRALHVPPSGMFDDAAEVLMLREAAQHSLRGVALPRIWLADCAGAGQAWTLAIILAEMGLLSHAEIHATVASDDMLDEATSAWLPETDLERAQERYVLAGGKGRLANYFNLQGGRAILAPSLRSHITWAQYNLVTDASFNEFNLIACQRALPDFGPLLRQRVLQLFHDSLVPFGSLGLDRELDPSESIGSDYQLLQAGQPWYKRVA
ncbi:MULTISPECIES: CheR family methyltransferase [unclassified Duganella]|uniref:CheR family methyltransferase n=1 Tax=unclassified Duganella TaxID=2636909 RepID=UPI0006F92420|nr:MULTISPECIES: CheR family methyltransferase [unclassified Duganella]KQV61752.1 chemotaxis protein [Duganella sp. Root336D2]KRB84258.1 chemotaxis protein [Duganella sp. Root198D2]